MLPSMPSSPKSYLLLRMCDKLAIRVLHALNFSSNLRKWPHEHYVKSLQTAKAYYKSIWSLSLHFVATGKKRRSVTLHVHLTLIARNVRVCRGINVVVLILLTVLCKITPYRGFLPLFHFTWNISFKIPKILLSEAQKGAILTSSLAW